MFLTSNLFSEIGIYNSVIGSLKLIIYESDIYPPTLPLGAIVEINNSKINKYDCFNK